MIDTLIRLLIAHAIGDVVFQTKWIAQNKGKYPLILFIHSIIVAGTTYLIVAQYTWVFLLTLITHFAIDFETAHIAEYLNLKDTPISKLTYLDNFLHGIVILIIWWFLR